jgi:hypothetical protein
MCVPHGATPGSNRGRGSKDGWGILRRVPLLTLIVKNRNAKHRMNNKWVPMEYRLAYLQNRWYAQYRPKYRKLMQRLNLRK